MKNRGIFQVATLLGVIAGAVLHSTSVMIPSGIALLISTIQETENKIIAEINKKG